jgi:hypothetical protein
LLPPKSGERLRKLGIRLAETRSTALFQRATELPAAILARTLGVHITVAVTWQRAAAGQLSELTWRRPVPVRSCAARGTPT